ncbi:MAG: hypothetical protein D4R95_04665 [Actinobacteria bacterium]|nr:MAG: hypothetical protein D4R95_04665 [Actinomycetota bacterium]
MKRRTLDMIFSAGGIAVAILLVLLGFVFKTNADFADSYVHDQLAEQKISFTAAEFLSDEEKTSNCLIENAGTPLDSGKKAECYANDYIGMHLKGIGGGETYATIGAIQTKAKTALADATAANASNVAELKADLDKITGQRETMFKGETLRGLLLTSYGFSIFGEKAALAGMLSFLGALVMLLASIAGFIHAFSSKGEKKLI